MSGLVFVIVCNCNSYVLGFFLNSRLCCWSTIGAYIEGRPPRPEPIVKLQAQLHVYLHCSQFFGIIG